jgi:lysophospholipase L1-like esterase
VRTITCFGDSNIYGAVPLSTGVSGRRYARDRRWPGILRRELGNEWEVIEEGQPGRTTVRDDPIDGEHKSGIRALPICLESHAPVDLVVLMLGTNDLKHRFAATPGDITDSIEVLVKAIRSSAAGPAGVPPAVIIVAPPPILEVGHFAEMFLGGAEKSRRLGPAIEALARRCGMPFVDAGALIQSSAIDGIHLDGDAHRVLGTAIAKVVLSSFPEV